MRAGGGPKTRRFRTAHRSSALPDHIPAQAFPEQAPLELQPARGISAIAISAMGVILLIAPYLLGTQMGAP
jgi:hypothetical protein